MEGKQTERILPGEPDSERGRLECHGQGEEEGRREPEGGNDIQFLSQGLGYFYQTPVQVLLYDGKE